MEMKIQMTDTSLPAVLQPELLPLEPEQDWISFKLNLLNVIFPIGTAH